MINLIDLKRELSLRLLTENTQLDRNVTGCYIGDLLSWVMANAKSGNVWLTVMGNINAIAVASLLNLSCIVLTENAHLDQNALEKAETENIPVFVTELNSYETATKISRFLQ